MNALHSALASQVDRWAAQVVFTHCVQSASPNVVVLDVDEVEELEHAMTHAVVESEIVIARRSPLMVRSWYRLGHALRSV